MKPREWVSELEDDAEILFCPTCSHIYPIHDSKCGLVAALNAADEILNAVSR